MESTQRAQGLREGDIGVVGRTLSGITVSALGSGPGEPVGRDAQPLYHLALSLMQGGQGQGRGRLAALPLLSLPPAPSLHFIRAVPFFSSCAPFPNLRLCHPLDLLSFLFPPSYSPCLTSRLPQRVQNGLRC